MQPEGPWQRLTLYLYERCIQVSLLTRYSHAHFFTPKAFPRDCGLTGSTGTREEQAAAALHAYALACSAFSVLSPGAYYVAGRSLAGSVLVSSELPRQVASSLPGYYRYQTKLAGGFSRVDVAANCLEGLRIGGTKTQS